MSPWVPFTFSFSCSVDVFSPLRIYFLGSVETPGTCSLLIMYLTWREVTWSFRSCPRRRRRFSFIIQINVKCFTLIAGKGEYPARNQAASLPLTFLFQWKSLKMSSNKAPFSSKINQWREVYFYHQGGRGWLWQNNACTICLHYTQKRVNF